MPAQSGKDILLKIGDGAGPEVFTALLGLRTKSLNINAEQIDITNSESVGLWRESLDGGGVKNMSVSGAGVFTDVAEDASLLADTLAGTKRNFQIVVPDFQTFEGPFQVTTLAYAGTYNGEVTFDVSLESAGEIAATPI